MTNLTAIDLFCGAGGLSEGFRQGGYHVLAGNDYDTAAGETFEATHSSARFLPGPIQNYTAADFLKGTGVRQGELDVIVGGPPCQGFSVYNHARGLHDERSSLYKEYLRIVDGLLPKWVVLENVTGMTSAGGGAAVISILDGLRSLGYAVEHRILKAEEYGIPQERRRILFVGNRIGAPIPWPSQTHGPGLKPFVNVRAAIGDLPALENGEDSGELQYLASASSAYQREMRLKSKVVRNHAAARLSAVNMGRLEHIPQGGSWRDIPYELLPAGMRRAKRSDHTKRYGRLSWDGLASTILTKCDPHWGAFFHPDQNRAITVREAARFQSFPDWFEFKGSRTEQYVQVGNAVPPLLGRTIADSIIAAQGGALAAAAE
ncbi:MULTISPECIES: DNA cytosine methyltransferase [Rhizobium]|jgi:DNA (cytosine-5)-methyltransferase 1|uniref:DNA cytosine methyltransferase n=1 Tax=Rhizobium TaxID=379 RepID=UPI0010326CC8|nr:MULTISPECIES: DNA cytosine methyltransferase [Rhizobium]MBB3303154.1 DNA (cytosine-5)-methyltransferase 1 [Rhizobium sp. BK112]MBB3372196.1 DNA (cytosine-5)-methyltransferase 1 [Rhizobium sp. BK077]MBB4183035.1 DNA (cytosine-5)-methyltransferase 1 [Rhizobium sp. BK109]TBC11356.1 DNA cytosine methyltransferase [Rhizobium ruizarguesonis]TBC59412.1 DNA cytosine methyltransferase [Rhizobium ruizarguesonis]